jgi:hypothetical protein
VGGLGGVKGCRAGRKAEERLVPPTYHGTHRQPCRVPGRKHAGLRAKPSPGKMVDILRTPCNPPPHTHTHTHTHTRTHARTHTSHSRRARDTSHRSLSLSLSLSLPCCASFTHARKHTTKPTSTHHRRAVFLERQFAGLRAKESPEKMVDILRKTWKKMGPRGRAAAVAALPSLAPEEQELVKAALAPPPPAK